MKLRIGDAVIVSPLFDVCLFKSLVLEHDRDRVVAPWLGRVVGEALELRTHPGIPLMLRIRGSMPAADSQQSAESKETETIMASRPTSSTAQSLTVETNASRPVVAVEQAPAIATTSRTVDPKRAVEALQAELLHHFETLNDVMPALGEAQRSASRGSWLGTTDDWTYFLDQPTIETVVTWKRTCDGICARLSEAGQREGVPLTTRLESMQVLALTETKVISPLVQPVINEAAKRDKIAIVNRDRFRTATKVRIVLFNGRTFHPDERLEQADIEEWRDNDGVTYAEFQVPGRRTTKLRNLRTSKELEGSLTRN